MHSSILWVVLRLGVAAACAPSQDLAVAVEHAVRRCPYQQDAVCCHANQTGYGTSFMAVCAAFEDYLDCSNECNVAAPVWSEVHSGRNYSDAIR